MKFFRPPIMRFDHFCELVGISTETGRRFRRKGYFGKLTYVENRPWITEAQALEFAKRAEAGEFDGLPKPKDQ